MLKLCDYMIIQRDLNGFGYADYIGNYKFEASDAVYVQVMSEEDNSVITPWLKCSIDKSTWSIRLKLPQGGLYKVTAKKSSINFNSENYSHEWETTIGCIRHFGVGDIFVMAGQSNMSAYGRDSAYDPPELGIHLYDNSGNWVLASHPLNDSLNPIYPNNDPNSGTSPGLSFARYMKRKLNLPIGLISAARGGSSIEHWNPRCSESYLFKSMLEKIECTGGFKGMIWYQGCNETVYQDDAENYYSNFCQAVSSWREVMGDFPIVTCQLNRHASVEKDNDVSWGLVREAQRKAASTIQNLSVIPTIDMYTNDGIHNSSSANVILGERMAKSMLNISYGFNFEKAPNVISVTKIDSNTIYLEFEPEINLKTMDNTAAGMNIEDEKGIADCIKLELHKNGVKVTAEREIGNNAYFHAYWRKIPPAFLLRDHTGLPMLACYGIKINEYKEILC